MPARQRPYQDDRLKLFSGNANIQLARDIADHIGISLGAADVSRFPNGEVNVMINESVRGCDVFVFQPTCAPVNEAVMELLIMVDALRRASARRITAVMPFFGYARQDRKTRPREPITAKLIANLLTTAGARRVLTMDLHAGQIQGFFDFPVDHLTAIPLLADYFVRKRLPDVAVFSPDVGGVTRANEMAKRLGATIGIIDKRRPRPAVAEVVNVIGEVEGKTVILVDDMIDTAGTIVKGAEALLARGAREVYACGIHPVLSGPARQRLDQSPLAEVVVTDSIPIGNGQRSPKLVVLSVAELLAEAIVRIHEDLSVSTMFE